MACAGRAQAITPPRTLCPMSVGAKQARNCSNSERVSDQLQGDLMSGERLTRRGAIKITALVGASLVAGRRIYAQQSSRDVLWLAEVQEPPAMLPPDAPQLSDLLTDSEGRKITSLEDWKKHREELRRWWLDFLGPMPAERMAAPTVTV